MASDEGEVMIWLFALEIGLLSGFESVGWSRYTWPENSTYVSMQVDGQWEFLFAGGEIENVQVMLNAHQYDPIHVTYRFNAGVRLGAFEAGWKHECKHPVVGRTDGARLTGGYDKLYARVEITR